MTSGVPLWVKVVVALYLALLAGCVVASLAPAEAHAQGALPPAASATVEERRHQETLAALSALAQPKAAPDHGGTIVVVVAALQLLQTLGIVGWAKWSVGQIAKDEASSVASELKSAIKEHNDSAYSHTVASEHNHRGIIQRIDEVDAEVAKVDKHLGLLQGLVQRLLAEHSIIHKLQLSRVSDVSPDDLFRAAPGDGGRQGGGR